jgi:hypothetical protein
MLSPIPPCLRPARRAYAQAAAGGEETGWLKHSKKNGKVNGKVVINE